MKGVNKMKKIFLILLATIVSSGIIYSQNTSTKLDTIQKKVLENFIKANPNIKIDQIKFEDKSQKQNLECGLVWVKDENGYSYLKATTPVCIWVNTPAPYGGITRMQFWLNKGDVIALEINRQGYTCGCN